MLYIEVPEKQETGLTKLFLAGSITGAPDWQKIIISKVKDFDIAIYNPRRRNFSNNISGLDVEQISWEHEYLEKADVVSFWFCKETLSPITLFELGTYSKISKPIVIGMDPEYLRRRDIEIQIGLVRPDVKIVYKLDDLVPLIYEMTVKLPYGIIKRL